MCSESQKPSNQEILEKMPNMLGAAIEAIVTFCKDREILSPKDKCSLFGFNKIAFDVYKNIDIKTHNQKEIMDSYFEKLKPDGFTKFKDAFEKAYDLILNSNINRNELIPVIILLTDGLDHGHEETIPYVKKVSYFI